MAAPGFRLGSGPLHGTKLPPFRSEQTSFLSTCLGFPPLQLVLMSFFPPVYHDSHRSSHSFTSVAPSGLAWHRDLRRPHRALVGFKLNNFSFPGALTYSISFDHHHHLCKVQRQQAQGNVASNQGQEGKLHTTGSIVRDGICKGWRQHTQVEEVTLDKDVPQPAIRSTNICGSMVQNVLSGDPLNVQRLCR